MLRDRHVDEREALTFPHRLHVAADRRLAHIRVVLGPEFGGVGTFVGWVRVADLREQGFGRGLSPEV
jgi:hypothetical protein